MVKNKSKLIEKIDLWITHNDASVSREKDVSVIFPERLKLSIENIEKKLNENWHKNGFNYIMTLQLLKEEFKEVMKDG